MTEESHLTRKLRFGAALGKEEACRLDRLVREAVPVPARTDLVVQYQATEHVHVVKSGVACRYKMMPDGRRAILALLLPGDFCDLHVAILDYMDHSIGTLVDCEISRVSRNEIECMLTHYPLINRACWWATLVDEAVLREWLVNIGRRRTDQQLAHLFCEIYVRLKAVGLAGDHSFRMPFTQETLGDLIGATQVHVQRTMAQLRGAGLITLQDRVIAFPDFDALAGFAEFEPGYLHLGGMAPGPDGSHG